MLSDEVILERGNGPSLSRDDDEEMQAAAVRHRHQTDSMYNCTTIFIGM